VFENPSKDHYGYFLVFFLKKSWSLLVSKDVKRDALLNICRRDTACKVLETRESSLHVFGYIVGR
jgi:hypothetical protein